MDCLYVCTGDRSPTTPFCIPTLLWSDERFSSIDARGIMSHHPELTKNYQQWRQRAGEEITDRTRDLPESAPLLSDLDPSLGRVASAQSSALAVDSTAAAIILQGVMDRINYIVQEQMQQSNKSDR